MLIIAIDTTTRAGSGAVARDGKVICEEPSDPARDHAAQLPGTLAAIVRHAGVDLNDVTAFAVATGPGSFTGLRIGIASMQGLAVARGKPLIGISALDAMYASCANPDNLRVATWMDAWRGEVFAALYENDRIVDEPIVGHPERVLVSLAGTPTMFVGDGAALYRDVIVKAMGKDAVFADPLVPMLAGSIALMATREAKAGRLPAPDKIQALYIRRSDAEQARDGGSGGPLSG